MEAVSPRTKPIFARIVERLNNGEGVTFEKTLTIHLPVSEIYNYLRNLENLPRFMKHLESVTVIDQTRSHWVAQLDGKTLKWDAQIVLDRVDEVISWQSSSGSEIRNDGSVWLKQASAKNGTVVRITLEYFSPARSFGAQMAKPFWRACRNDPPKRFSPVQMPAVFLSYSNHQRAGGS
jgi:uncharacterized membrane protein